MSERTLDEIIAEMEDLLSKMRTVKDGDPVQKEDVNYINKFVKDAVEALTKLYEMYKEKTGEVIPEVENLINTAVTRQVWLIDYKSGDIITPSAHNNLIDTMKPVDVALKLIESRL
ncbi:MAG: hypothetical protein NDF55_10785 [archaeon GB-1867-005]|nr:hypothetical protein [Candidatus Culexmicrobium cathedralense]